MVLPWFEDVGDAEHPSVVLLHAFPLSSVMYDRLVPELLDAGLRVVRIDLPGLGRSADAVRGLEPSVAAMADAVGAVLASVGLRSATVLGISTGGYVALELAARHPEAVGALALGSTTSRVIAPDVPEERRALADELAAVGSVEPVRAQATAGLGPTATRDQPDLAPVLRAVVEAADPAGLAWAARAVAARRDTTAVVSAFPGPVLLLFGAEDVDTPPVRADELAAARSASPGATRTVVLPATGHLTALERPVEVAAELLSLVQTLSAR